MAVQLVAEIRCCHPKIASENLPMKSSWLGSQSACGVGPEPCRWELVPVVGKREGHQPGRNSNPEEGRPPSQIAKEARGRLPPDFGCRSVGKRRQVGRRHRLHPLAAPRTTSSPEPPSARPSAGSADG